jgi:hypothetical protein
VNASSLVTREIPKAASTQKISFRKGETVGRNMQKIVSPPGFWTSIYIGTNSFWKLYCDCTRGFPEHQLPSEKLGKLVNDLTEMQRQSLITIHTNWAKFTS